jgi:hypothetical protein
MFNDGKARRTLLRGGMVAAPLVFAWHVCPESVHEEAVVPGHEHVPHEDHVPPSTRPAMETLTSASSLANPSSFKFDFTFDRATTDMKGTFRLP